MAFSTDSDRRMLKDTDFGLDFVVQATKGDRETEMEAEDVEHALELQAGWLDIHQADKVEIFRVRDDGSLKPTLGPVFKKDED
jgi:hypothetical protein